MGLIEDAEGLLVKTKADSVLVGLSGGKDSIATLDLCVRRFQRVEAFFMHLVPGLWCEDAMLARVLKHFPSVKLHRLPHFDLSRYQRENAFGCNPRLRKVALLSLAQVEAHLRALTGIEWFAYGERSSDGFARRAKLNPIGGFWEKFQRVYPIYRWKERNVYAYIRQRKLPCPTQKLGGRAVSGSVDLHPKSLEWLRDTFPDDYAKLVRVFPLAPAALFRWEAGLAPDRKGIFHDGTKTRRDRPGDPAGEEGQEEAG